MLDPTVSHHAHLREEHSNLDCRERLLKTQDKDLLHRDKLLKQKELDFRNNIECTASQDAYILTMEEKLKT